MAGRATARIAWSSIQVGDALEDARGDALFEEGHASGLADEVAEP